MDEQNHIYDRTNLSPPMGLLSIKNYIKHFYPDVQIEIIDGMLEAEKNLQNKLEGISFNDLVGISITSGNSGAAFNIAKRLKDKGAFVLVGGPHVSLFYREILLNRNYIDICVIGDGEKALKIVVEKGIENLDNVPNIAYKNGRIKATKYEPTDWWNLPVLKREFSEMQRYTNVYKNLSSEGKITNTESKFHSSIFTHRGCKWRDKSGGCLFCSSINPFGMYAQRNPLTVWEEIGYLYDNFGIDHLLDHSDYLTFEWLKEFSKTKPRDIPNVSLSFFTKSSEITDEFANYLSNINCAEVRLGIESGDNETLKNTIKGTTVKQHLNAVKILKKYNIDVMAGIVFGLLDDNKKSLKKTLDLISELYTIGNISYVCGSMLIPYPGSKAFDLLKERLLKKGEISPFQDVFSLSMLSKKWLREFTCITEEDVESAQIEIGKVTHRTNPSVPIIIMSN
ncbi:MAG TPA: B12-binding domain-containing radical SAM protein [Candidatus Wunengus sp. YC65]|uniref:B12-binding domain-containing radical SAM protein n=1 Tax=Candidatus Wunengus sp. YC65 TaxID=3367701 RepID=UPI0040267D08